MTDAPEPFLSASGDPILLTPGPLTTSPAVKAAMLHDLGSRDRAFIDLNARVCARLAGLAGAGSGGYACVPVQGSGTYAVEAMLGTLLPPGGRLLNLVNGAYGRRIGEIGRYLGREVQELAFAETEPVAPARVAAALQADEGITHVALVHCETTSGLLNPLAEVAAAVRGAGRALLVDAMSSFGALPIAAAEAGITALAASANKCLQGVPGLAFCIAREDALAGAAGNAHSLSLDLHAQWQALAASGQYRFTPPTHALLALDRALEELAAEGGRAAREARYRESCRVLREGMAALGFEPLLEGAAQAPVIVSFREPADPRFAFERFYAALARRGFLIYPGKLTDTPGFRVGCIGAVDAAVMRRFVAAAGAAAAELGLTRPGA